MDFIRYASNAIINDVELDPYKVNYVKGTRLITTVGLFFHINRIDLLVKSSFSYNQSSKARFIKMSSECDTNTRWFVALVTK
jgi:hypothetical protein